MARVDDKRLELIRPLADEVVIADITKPETLDAAFAGVTYCYHLAGVVSIASKVDAALYAVNVTGVQNVIDACLKHGIKRLVETGTCHTIPFRDKTSVLREVPHYQTELIHGAYAVTKCEGSNLVLDAVAEKGLDAVIGMPTGIIGAYEMKLSNFGQMLASVAEKKMPVCVKGGYDWVDVKDVAWAMAELCDKGVKGESYLISGEQASLRDLMNWAAEAAGVHPPKITLPLGFVRIFGYPAEWISLLFDQPLMFTPYALDAVGQNYNFTHEKLTALTGYKPRSVREAVHEQVKYYFDVYKPQLSKKALSHTASS
jgi:dihydroflavonol-4-reductase